VSSQRYRIVLIPEASGSLVPRRSLRRRDGRRSRAPEDNPLEPFAALAVLLKALQRVNRRGQGPAAWAPVADDPLSFLLDSMSDALIVRGPNGQVHFANPMAREWQMTDRDFTPFEEFEQGGLRFRARGLEMNLPEGQLTFTLVSRIRRSSYGPQ